MQARVQQGPAAAQGEEAAPAAAARTAAAEVRLVQQLQEEAG